MAMSMNTGWAQPEYLNLNNSALEPSPAPGLQQGPVLRLVGVADHSCRGALKVQMYPALRGGIVQLVVDLDGMLSRLPLCAHAIGD